MVVPVPTMTFTADEVIEDDCAEESVPDEVKVNDGDRVEDNEEAERANVDDKTADDVLVGDTESDPVVVALLLEVVLAASSPAAASRENVVATAAGFDVNVTPCGPSTPTPVLSSTSWA